MVLNSNQPYHKAFVEKEATTAKETQILSCQKGTNPCKKQCNKQTSKSYFWEIIFCKWKNDARTHQRINWFFVETITKGIEKWLEQASDHANRYAWTKKKSILNKYQNLRIN